MSAEIQEYTDKHLVGLSDKEHIRTNPSGYVVQTDAYGQYHTIKEVLDNAIDEISILPDAHVDIVFFQNLENNTHQIAIIDTGRGIPHGSIFRAVTELKFSGKFTTEAYKVSSGIFGYGLTVATSLSSRYKVISKRDNSVVSVENLDDGILPVQKEATVTDGSTGTVVVLQIADQYFTDVDKFTLNGYNVIIDFLQVLSIFSNTTTNPNHQKYRFFLCNHPIDEKFWTLPPELSVSYIQDTYFDKSVLMYDSIDASNVGAFLADLWNLDCTFIWSEETLFKSELSPTEELKDIKDPSKGYRSLGYDVRLFLPKIMRPGKCLSLVNNVVMKRQSSSHIEVVTSILKQKLKDFITDEQIRKYFLDIYDLPICYAIDIKYEGAKFSGVTKDGFSDNKFAVQFEKRLLEQMSVLEDKYWLILCDYLLKNIENSYNMYYNKPMVTNRLKSLLDTSVKIYTCDASDRTQAELFIVEGTSAAHIIEARDADKHALMMIRGKPDAVLIDALSMTKSIALLKKCVAYSDLMKLLNVYPEYQDLSSCQYGKIIISTDADFDGYHIGALHVAALYTINPRLISEGYVYIANPPLYEIYPKNRKSHRILLRDKYNLMGFRAGVYDHLFKIHCNGTNGIVEVTGEEFKGLCMTVLEIGDYLSEYAGQYAASPILIERLALITHALNPNCPNIGLIQQTLGTRVHYIPQYRAIRIEAGDKDIVISLSTFVQQLYDHILPMLKQYAWDKMEFYLTTKQTDKYQQKKLSYAQLYEIFEVINNEAFHIKRHKGLGGMNVNDLRSSFIDENTRRLQRLTSIGDVEVIYGLMGVDVTMRKQLLSDKGLS